MKLIFFRPSLGLNLSNIPKFDLKRVPMSGDRPPDMRIDRFREKTSVMLRTHPFTTQRASRFLDICFAPPSPPSAIGPRHRPLRSQLLPNNANPTSFVKEHC